MLWKRNQIQSDVTGSFRFSWNGKTYIDNRKKSTPMFTIICYDGDEYHNPGGQPASGNEDWTDDWWNVHTHHDLPEEWRFTDTKWAPGAASNKRL